MEKETQNNEDQFPGYPHYPSGEDITNPRNGMQQVNLVPGGTSAPHTQDAEPQESDVSEDEKEMLTAAFQNRDLEQTDKERSGLDETDEDGEPLNEGSGQYGAQGSDLDIPGGEADDAGEQVGSEDEENNYYSLGGDEHNSLEEDTDR